MTGAGGTVGTTAGGAAGWTAGVGTVAASGARSIGTICAMAGAATASRTGVKYFIRPE
jgi:hypothetical protein